jgi:hypothetical protein
MIADTHAFRLAKLLGAYSHLDAQSGLAVTVLIQLSALGYEGAELEQAFEARMKTHRDQVRELQMTELLSVYPRDPGIV